MNGICEAREGKEKLVTCERGTLNPDAIGFSSGDFILVLTNLYFIYQYLLCDNYGQVEKKVAVSRIHAGQPSIAVCLRKRVREWSRILGPLHTRDWEPVTIALLALSLVEKGDVNAHYAWGINGVCQCKMDVKSTWISIWHRMDHVSWSLGLFSNNHLLEVGLTQTGRPCHSECLLWLIYSIFIMCEDSHENKFVEIVFDWGLTYIWLHSTLEGLWPHYSTCFWRCLQTAFGNFLLSSHKSMVATLGSCMWSGPCFMSAGSNYNWIFQIN